MDDKYYSVTQVAKILSVSRASALKLVSDKAIPAYRIGRVYRISESDLNGYLERVKTV